MHSRAFISEPTTSQTSELVNHLGYLPHTKNRLGSRFVIELTCEDSDPVIDWAPGEVKRGGWVPLWELLHV